MKSILFIFVLILSQSLSAKEYNEEQSLLDAATKGDLPYVKKEIYNGADIKAKTTYGYTPLHLATWSGNLKIVKLLLSKGAHINAETNDGDTSLEIAEYNLFYDISIFLKAKGAKFKPKK